MLQQSAVEASKRAPGAAALGCCGGVMGWNGAQQRHTLRDNATVGWIAQADGRIERCPDAAAHRLAVGAPPTSVTADASAKAGLVAGYEVEAGLPVRHLTTAECMYLYPAALCLEHVQHLAEAALPCRLELPADTLRPVLAAAMEG